MSTDDYSGRPEIRILACLEAHSVTGPAKNLLLVGKTLLGMAERFQMRVATFGRAGIRNGFADACRDGGLPVELIHERRRFDVGVVPQLRDIIERYQPDVIQTHNTKSHFLIRASGIYRKIPWIAFNHGYTAEDLRVKLYNQVDRWSLPAAHRVVVVCDAFGQRLRRWGVREERILVRHNSVAPLPPAPAEECQRLRQELGIPAGSTVLLSVGRLSREKGHRDLVHAIAELRRRCLPQDFRVVILGEGPERGPVQELCRAQGVSDVMIFAGVTKNVSPYLALADVFVLPSHSEGSPNALIEAMMSGTACVATSVGGVPEILTSGVTGLLVPPREPVPMADAITELLRNPPLRQELGQRARERVIAHHSPGAYIDWMLALYEGLAGRTAECGGGLR